MSIGPRPPAGLQIRGKALWRDVVSTYVLDPAELALLVELCCTVDEIDRLTCALSAQEMVVTGSTGQPKANPLLAELREHRKVSERLAAALALPIPGESAGRRRSRQAKSAAQTRWNRAKSGPKLVDNR
ncbi:hypothetical protein BST27_18575 [Mycobacterium intermedium]|uniref:Terminase n=1 Tax=Mycobacterium intermedium TaxID=28445 RepID=A0A1E3SF11_MYCIE|nr:P27 family phage terminase small subunit [Mycobacterium intermedium]MCV6963076.1 hypothetical protein [Mycobacterium intermedium]ODR00739.1 hypothetical protein BHQ20_11825 [Mycobacterium intermedium]OPE52352.1 hypothetical protein BV508_02805 [Mycobacterium intermedium]ORB00293.1 hypothetical protein BST27_18575 [Mycobacterium intermedium]